MTDSFPNASAARKLSKFLSSDEGRRYLSDGGPSGNGIALCRENEALADVIERARAYAPSVTLAVEYSDSEQIKLVTVAISEVAASTELHAGTVDPKATVGMILEYVNTCGGEFSFRLTEWSAPLEAKQLQTA